MHLSSQSISGKKILRSTDDMRLIEQRAAQVGMGGQDAR